MKSTIKHSRLRGLVAPLALFCSLAIAAPANADVAIIVNAANKQALDAAAVARIFFVQLREFPGKESADPVYQPSGSKVDTEFTDKMTSVMPPDIKKAWARLQFTGGVSRPRTVGSDDEVINFVAAHASAIGYVDASKIHGDVRVVMKF